MAKGSHWASAEAKRVLVRGTARRRRSGAAHAQQDAGPEFDLAQKAEIIFR